MTARNWTPESGNGDMSERKLAWYFSNNECILRYGDGRKIKPGITHEVIFPFTDEDGATWDKPSCCDAGLHASERIIDAISYAPGNWLWRVVLFGDMDSNGDKLCATHRKYLWGFKSKKILRKFARKCALSVVDKWDAPDIVRQYLETGDESIRAAARDAARDAAKAAARDAARDAAKAAARAAERDATRDAAWDAAIVAARAAESHTAWAAARDAKLNEFNNLLEQMVTDEAKERGLI